MEHGLYGAGPRNKGIQQWLGKNKEQGRKCLGEEQKTGEAMVERSRNRGSNCRVKRARYWGSTDRGGTN